MKKFSTMYSLLFTIIVGALFYYLTFPAINIHNVQFWFFVLMLVVIFVVLKSILSFGIKQIEIISNRKKYKLGKSNYKIVYLIPIVIIGIILINIVLSPLFCSKAYYKRITINTEGVFSDDVKEVDFNKMPLLDRDSSEKLGDRTMGQMSELVSQFDVSDMYTQINYNDEIVRVTPLEYNGAIKWFTNRRNGIKGYITVNSTTGKSKLVKLEKGMRYAPSGLFNENLYRKLQLSYPTMNIGAVNFEIDNEGNPYWIASTVKYKGVGLRRDVNGVIIFNPINGKSKFYKVKDVPTWVDHVYEADLILEQVNDWGRFKNGFINSLISQKGVVKSTRGYNYLAQDGDIYLYTGITSVIGDESNIGFILTNMRTKETNFYSVAGAEEYSAMESAKGQVQEKNYNSTFPLLINLSGKPTYLISLKDNAGLVKMYAFVDVVDYQKVVVTDSSSGIQKAAEAYLAEDGSVEEGNIEKEITVNNITSAIIEGNTYYYFKDEDGQKYKASIKISKNNLPFIKDGDVITIKYSREADVISVTDIEV